ncbi:enoyl-CoA hydratase/isomerase family protein [Paenochrobactrum pullorum]|uniref:enoyl-CoA hydratase/isomerase family protein n=1 Tax=Paenochrobactrum pullorum TaxID=1324351 RepID=UPI0035BBE324
MQINFGADNQILFEQHGTIGLIRLQRPKSLNALTHEMIKAIRRALQAWKDDHSIAAVLIEGEGRAFCAGGDVVEVYHLGREGKYKFQMFADEYAMNAEIASFPKPYISLLDGITMGGGAGVSVHGTHRIVTENTMFAMPESAIGFFTDVGASVFLPPLEGNFGIYLALTGNIIRWGDCLQSGIATHAMKSEHLAEFRRVLFATGDLDQALVHLDYPDFETSVDDRALIADCFGFDTLAECLSALEAVAKENVFAADALTVLAKRSPTSLAVIFEQMKRAKVLGFDERMQMEYRIACHMIKKPDFYEGVRAALVEKGTQPVWRPEKLEDVSDEDVGQCFSPLSHGELEL